MVIFMEEKEKFLLIMRYLHSQDYFRSNQMRVAKNNLARLPKGDVYSVLEYYKECCYKEMWDKVFTDLSRLLYNS